MDGDDRCWQILWQIDQNNNDINDDDNNNNNNNNNINSNILFLPWGP